MKHGLNCYNWFGCRCEIGRQARLEYGRAYAKRKAGTEPNQHGTQTAYLVHKCRCPQCREWAAHWNAKRRETVAAQKGALNA